MAMIDDLGGHNCLSPVSQFESDLMPVDSAKVSHWIRLLPAQVSGEVKPSIDPVSEYFSKAIDCPRKMLAISLATGGGVSLDSTCKL